MNTQKLFNLLETPGNTPLWQVFWLHGVLVSHILFGAILTLYGNVGSSLLALLLLGFIAYTAWLLNSVWRNSNNVQNQAYGEIARLLTVAWSINALFVSCFLQLQHLGTGGASLSLPF